jgi:hypothetical protein
VDFTYKNALFQHDYSLGEQIKLQESYQKAVSAINWKKGKHIK